MSVQRSLLPLWTAKAAPILWMTVLILRELSNPSVSYPGRDGGIFLYIGSLILKGRVPYRDVWENKGPLVFYLNALGLWLANNSRWGVWGVELVFLVAGSWFGYVALRRLLGTLPALLGAFVWISAIGRVLQ